LVFSGASEVVVFEEDERVSLPLSDFGALAALSDLSEVEVFEDEERVKGALSEVVVVGAFVVGAFEVLESFEVEEEVRVVLPLPWDGATLSQ
jgi:hypothetical protein